MLYDYIKNDSLNSFNKIYQDNYHSMIRVATRILNDEDAVSDIVQEVFVHLYETLKSKIVIQHPKSWLYRITYNKCIDHLRRVKKFQKIEMAHTQTVTDNQLEEKETKSILQHSLSKLNPKERLLMVLYSEGLSYKEMASVTGIKFSSIGKTISRTLKKIENELKEVRYEMY